MRFCQNCGAQVPENALFCEHCGHRLVPVQGRPAAPAQPRRSLYENATDFVAKYAGEDSVTDISLRSLFSGVFNHHSQAEADELFIAGTETTTPPLASIDDDSVKPWLFSRVFMWFAIAFFALYFTIDYLNGSRTIAALIFVSAFAVPVAGLVFFYEVNVLRNISFFETIKFFFIGGIFSLVLTLLLYGFTWIGNTLTFGTALTVGFVEETGKILLVAYFVSKLNAKYVLNGLLIGAAVGAGFAALESAGYIYESRDLLQEALMRAWTGVGTHMIWTAIAGAGLVLAKGDKPFAANQLFTSRFLTFYLTAVGLHFLWDWETMPVFGDSTFKYIALIIVGWVVVLSLVSVGLKQISRAKQALLAPPAQPQAPQQPPFPQQ